MIFNEKIRMIVNDISLLNNNIILLGENSVGKTTILREIYLKNRETSLYIENHKSKDDLFEKISLINDKIKTILIDNIDVNLEIKDNYYSKSDIISIEDSYNVIITIGSWNDMIYGYDGVSGTITGKIGSFGIQARNAEGLPIRLRV